MQGDSWEADAVNKESDAACSVLNWNEPPHKLKEGDFSLENIFEEAVIIISSIKSQPLGTRLLKYTA